MPIRLDSRADDFAARFGVFLAAKRESAAEVEQVVRGILAEVMARGDAALVEFTRTFDRTEVDAGRRMALIRRTWEVPDLPPIAMVRSVMRAA